MGEDVGEDMGEDGLSSSLQFHHIISGSLTYAGLVSSDHRTSWPAILLH